MPYVMIPVPEEFQDELMQEVLMMSLRERLGSWEAEPLQELTSELDPMSRRLVDLLVDACVAGHRLSETEVATALGHEPGELQGLVEGVNSRCTAASMPYLILTAPSAGSEEENDLLVTQTAAVHLVEMARGAVLEEG